MLTGVPSVLSAGFRTAASTLVTHLETKHRNRDEQGETIDMGWDLKQHEGMVPGLAG